MMNVTELSKDILYITGLIDNHADLISAIEETEDNDKITALIPKWKTWEACSGECYIYGTNKNINSDHWRNYKSGELSKVVDEDTLEKFSYIFGTINSAFRKSFESYREFYKIEDPLNMYPDVGINKYNAGTFMGGHFDQQEGDTRLRYSVVLYLNDEYEGGEISFTVKDGIVGHEEKPHPDFLSEINEGRITVSIKPEAGSAIVFPSSSPYSHTAHLVKSGHKYMCPSFWFTGVEFYNNGNV
jgi:hypothetical protein